jgi:hypothetical protein
MVLKKYVAPHQKFQCGAKWEIPIIFSILAVRQ